MSVLMVVEDEPDIRLLIGVILAREPRLKLMAAAETAQEALDLLDSTAPGLIILDHGLPGGLTGIAAAPLFKAKAPSAKILLFTAYDLQAEAAAEPAIDEFLRKDNIGNLLSTVRRLLDLDSD